MNEIKLSRKVAKKVLDVVDAGIIHGLGKPIKGKMCIEAAVCYALGLPHGDNPPCVGDAVRSFKIRLNDSPWPTDEDRTKGMRRLAIAQLGSNEIDQREFARMVTLKTIQRIVPFTVELALKIDKTLSAQEKRAIKNLSDKCKVVDDLKEGGDYCLKIKSKLSSAAYASAAVADASAYAYAYAAVADASAYAYAYAAVADASASAARSEVLNMSAQIGLEALIELKSPGCKWLDLCD